MNYPYEYFSGANVIVELDDQTLIECAGISFVINESTQPAYGYASHLYDVVLPGRRVIQGNFVINFTNSREKNSFINNLYDDDSFGHSKLFNIKVYYGGDQSQEFIEITSCFLISRGQTIQVSEQVILEEYGFIGRNISNDVQR